MHFRLFGTNSFHVKAKKERFTAQACVVVRTSNMKISRRRLADYVKKLHQKRAARVARLFFHIQPIKSLVCGVDVGVGVAVAVAVVIS